MLLGAVMLKNVQGVNSFQRTQQLTIRQGSPSTVYFQLVDLEQVDSYGQPLRYVPASGSSVTATIGSISAANVIQRVASNPFSDDKSIWSMNLLSTDNPTSGNFAISLSQSGIITTTSVQNGVVVWATDLSFA